MEKIHFIAIGGSAMHNLAIALHLAGYKISGSDDEIFEPSNSRLKKYGLLPQNVGWDSKRISDDIDVIIVGMHARNDNPELLEAKKKAKIIYSYPEFLYKVFENKERVVITGSHGKTTITSMLIHIFNKLKIDIDYMVGAQLKGFEVMVKISDKSKTTIIEGDEYLSSPLDLRPKFVHYKPNIAILTGISWDHFNVFPNFEDYSKQFEYLIESINVGGTLIYNQNDNEVVKLIQNTNKDINFVPYTCMDYKIKDGIYYIDNIPIGIFGKHNIQNLTSVYELCKLKGIDKKDFIDAISDFEGASKRLELIHSTNNSCVYKDFAHSPSKVEATINAVKEQYPKRKLFAVLELHTFSSLNIEFMKKYKNTMSNAEQAIVYYNPKAVEHKKLNKLNIEEVKISFDKNDLIVFDDSKLLLNYLKNNNYTNTSLLLMSSGNFDGINIEEIF